MAAAAAALNPSPHFREKRGSDQEENEVSTWEIQSRLDLVTATPHCNWGLESCHLLS